MKAITAVLVLGLLCGADARWELRWHFGRNLLQVTPVETQPTAATTPVAAQNGPTVQPQTAQTAPATGAAAPGTVPGAAAAQPSAAAGTAPTATVPGTAAAKPAAAATAPTAADQPVPGTAAATKPAAAATAPTATATTAPGAAAAQPAAGTEATTTDSTAPPASPSLTNYQGRQGVYVIADPAPPPRAAAAPAAAAAANRTAAAPAGPPALAAGNNLIVVFTVMGEDAKTIYKTQQSLRKQVAAAAGVDPSQVLFYNQTANQDPRTGVTALSLSMAVDCGNPAACARAGAALQNTTSQTKLSDSLAREGVSVMTGTFQVYGVNSFGRYKGNDTLYEDKNLFAPKAASLNYNETIAKFGNASAALPGTLPGMPLGNFSIPGFSADNTSTAGAVQPGFNLSTFQVPQGLLPAGASPLGNASEAQSPVAPPVVRSSASGILAGAFTMLLATAAAMLI